MLFIVFKKELFKIHFSYGISNAHCFHLLWTCELATEAAASVCTFKAECGDLKCSTKDKGNGRLMKE